MYSAIIIHAPIRGGKTEACKCIASRCTEAGLEVGGIISPCKVERDETVGYNCVDLSSRKSFPLVKLGLPDEGWYQHGSLKYVFSESGFREANDILIQCSNGCELIIIDEFGRIEKEREGLYTGFQSVSQNMKRGICLISCRGDLVETVKEYLPKGVKTHVFEASELEKIWALISNELM